MFSPGNTPVVKKEKMERAKKRRCQKDGEKPACKHELQDHGDGLVNLAAVTEELKVIQTRCLDQLMGNLAAIGEELKVIQTVCLGQLISLLSLSLSFSSHHECDELFHCFILTL